MDVEAVISRIDALNGQTVSVVGYLGECGGYECTLYRTKDDAVAFRQWIRDIVAGRPSNMTELPMLGIGGGMDFDAKAASFTDSYVVITGKVSNRCRNKGKPACTDRSPDLEPVAIRSASKVAD